MPVVLTFNKISELRPEHRQEVVVIENNWKKNLDALYLREIMAENVWVEYNEDWSTGTVLEFTPNVQPPSDCKLETIFGSRVAQEDDLWMDSKEFEKAFSIQHQ